MEIDEQLIQNGINTKKLYREENYTDLASGGVKAFFPVNADGSADDKREPTFIAITNIQGPGGTFPIHGSIENAETLEEALEQFKPTLDVVIKEMIDVAEKQEAAYAADGGDTNGTGQLIADSGGLEIVE